MLRDGYTNPRRSSRPKLTSTAEPDTGAAAWPGSPKIFGVTRLNSANYKVYIDHICMIYD